mgnify:CR=1 FL=1
MTPMEPVVKWSCSCGTRGTNIPSFNAHTQTCPMVRFSLVRWERAVPQAQSGLDTPPPGTVG